MSNYEKYITSDNNIRFGKPIIAGTRISVQDVLDWLSKGMNTCDILYDFPELTKEQIDACKWYGATLNYKP